MKNGVVTKKLADKFWVKTDDKTECCVARGNLKIGNIYVGDKVDIDNLVIEKVHERKNKLIRPPVANLDQLIIVISPIPKPDFMLVDKLLIFCKVNDITPIICINKTDLECDELIEYTDKAYGKFIKIVKTNHSADNKELLKVLNGKVNAFAGQSAVGKSALINNIVPNANVISGELSEKIGRGKQTTRHCELFEINNSSFIVDTAGFTSLDEKLLPISYFELGYYYDDFIKYLPECKYKSCLHQSESEKECGIKQAVKNNLIDKARYERYLVILKILKEQWVRTHG